MREVDVIFTIFISLYYVLMVPMGGAAEFGAINLTEEDLTASPDLETPVSGVYHLEDDAESMENVQFYNLSDVDGEVGIFTSTSDYDINTVVGRNTTGGPSNITYDVSNLDRLEYLVTNRVLESPAVELTFVDSDETHIVIGPGTIEVPEGETAVAFSFDQEDEQVTDQYLYFLEGSSGADFDGVTGFLSLAAAWIGSIINYISSLAAIAASLPFYLNIPFGLYFVYFIFRAVSLLN